MSEALRFNRDKPMMSYFMRSFPKMAEAVARVKEMGAIKYNDGNWKLGNKPDKEYWDSMSRHLNYIFGGEFYDSDTGCLHIAHAVWNLCAMLELNYPDLPARDEAIWANRAEHWAKEKRKRESNDEVPGKFKVFHAAHCAEERKREDAEDIMAVEGLGAAEAARWAEEKERKREASEDVKTVEEMGADLVARWAEEEKQKREAEWQENPRFVGDVFDELFGPGVDLLLIPESAEFVATEMPKPGLVSTTFSPVFTAFIEKLTTRDDEIRSQYVAHCAEERKREACEAIEGWAATCTARWAKEEKRKRETSGVAVEGAGATEPTKPAKVAKPTWTTFIARRGGGLDYVDPCPMCGHSDNILLNGERGLECPECGEIFGVPLVPENEEFVISPGSKSVGVSIRDADKIEEERKRCAAVDATLYTAGANDAVDASVYAAACVERIMENLLPKECPQCGSSRTSQDGERGMLCLDCGEVFEVPIVPENTPLYKDVKFIIRDTKPSQAFTAMMNRVFNTLGRE